MNYCKFMAGFFKEFYKAVWKEKATLLWAFFTMTGLPLIGGTFLFLLGTKAKKES